MTNSIRSRLVVAVLTLLTMLAFAGNSLLTRLAFQTTHIDAALFTAVRLGAGAVVLFALLHARPRPRANAREAWLSAALLFVYAAAMSYAYRGIGTGAGALVLFAAAQVPMVVYGYRHGERTSVLGALLAFGGLTAFLRPWNASPTLGAAALMAVAGIAWGLYSLRGRATESALQWTANSFICTVPMALGWLLLTAHAISVDTLGIAYAALSGGITSALAYVLWYWVRTRMSATGAGAVQLSVPVFGVLLGALILDEPVTAYSLAAGAVTLAGVALVSIKTRR
ncbi:DMT family transporter [Comamonas sp. 17RB]|uniref:DMT family transporter n=1 Tax=Comamonas sp. 17RB TaxID=3047025 RepID=UPI0024B6C8AE|nr:DMT family transporter [Comamonas sp. 17RB]MDI9854032.1 DMT family transporter [Comamonas sp. 17RB]